MGLRTLKTNLKSLSVYPDGARKVVDEDNNKFSQQPFMPPVKWDINAYGLDNNYTPTFMGIAEDYSSINAMDQTERGGVVLSMNRQTLDFKRINRYYFLCL